MTLQMQKNVLNVVYFYGQRTCLHLIELDICDFDDIWWACQQHDCSDYVKSLKNSKLQFPYNLAKR